jgi:hypothetical protein
VCHRLCHFPASGAVIVATDGGTAATATCKGKGIMTDEQAEIDLIVSVFYRTWRAGHRAPTAAVRSDSISQSP